MIPIRDTCPSRNYPIANHCLIGLNVIVYLYQLMQGADLNRFIYLFGLVPARYTVESVSAYFPPGLQIFSLLSFMFLHGGFWHLLGNMWSLYIFGDNVEDRLGPFRFIFFYLLCGLTSGLFHLVLNVYSNVPTIGASGAVAGVMGAYILIAPRAKILTLVPILFIPLFFEIPALYYLSAWFIIQFINAAGSIGDAGQIAWWAHVGGFLAGLFFLKFFFKLPSIGLSRRVRRLTTKRHSHRLQVVKPAKTGGDELDLFGVVQVSPYEALVGTSKMVSLPLGRQKRLIKIAVPAGIQDGKQLRLRGLGRQIASGRQGDLYLTVVVQ